MDPNGDAGTLLRISKQLAELRSVLVEVERKLRQGHDVAPQPELRIGVSPTTLNTDCGN